MLQFKIQKREATPPAIRGFILKSECVYKNRSEWEKNSVARSGFYKTTATFSPQTQHACVHPHIASPFTNLFTNEKLNAIFSYATHTSHANLCQFESFITVPKFQSLCPLLTQTVGPSRSVVISRESPWFSVSNSSDSKTEVFPSTLENLVAGTPRTDVFSGSH